jgi:hypothetical protein
MKVFNEQKRQKKVNPSNGSLSLHFLTLQHKRFSLTYVFRAAAVTPNTQFSIEQVVFVLQEGNQFANVVVIKAAKREGNREEG